MKFLNGKKTYIGGVFVLMGMVAFVVAYFTADTDMAGLSEMLLGIGFGGAFIGLGHKGQKILMAILELAAYLKKLADAQPPEDSVD